MPTTQEKLFGTGNTAVFADRLRAELESLPVRNHDENRLLRFLMKRNGLRKRLRLKILESRAAEFIGKEAEAIDWDKVRMWLQIIAAVLSIALIFLAEDDDNG